MAKGLEVTVSRKDGRTTTVKGRVAKMILWLIANQERIDRMERGAIVFHCKGTSIHVVVNDHDDLDAGKLLRDLRVKALRG